MPEKGCDAHGRLILLHTRTNVNESLLIRSELVELRVRKPHHNLLPATPRLASRTHRIMESEIRQRNPADINSTYEPSFFFVARICLIRIDFSSARYSLSQSCENRKTGRRWTRMTTRPFTEVPGLVETVATGIGQDGGDFGPGFGRIFLRYVS